MKLNAITIAVVLVSSLGFTAGVLVPGLRDLDAKRKEIATEQEAVTERQREVGDVGAAYEELMALSNEVSDFRLQLPNDRRSGSFIDDLTDVLTSCGIRDYLPQQEAGLRVNSEKLPENLKIAEGTEILPVKVAFESEFRDAFQVIEKLESMSRLVYIEQVEMKMPEEGVGDLSVTMIVHAYHRNHEALGIFSSKGEPTQP